MVVDEVVVGVARLVCRHRVGGHLGGRVSQPPKLGREMESGVVGAVRREVGDASEIRDDLGTTR
jgi:hypothetical protein